MEGLEELFWKLIKSKVICQSIYAVVTKINDNQTIACEGLETQTIYTDVQLTATETKESYILVTPKIGSTVILSFLNNNINDAYVSGFSDLDKIQLIIAHSQLTINKDGIVMNGGDLGGLVIVQKLVGKINALEQKYNDLLNSCKTQVVTLAPSGTFPMASFFASNLPIAPKTSVGDLENEKVKH
ncbi:MAG: hypothetical protein EAZ27_04450 [Cytophagales bacterium]|nr:MAG: hypothetical protein EAZ27_04450 [Cytophagales bacterium]